MENCRRLVFMYVLRYMSENWRRLVLMYAGSAHARAGPHAPARGICRRTGAGSS
jgi:hypothetical protein